MAKLTLVLALLLVVLGLAGYVGTGSTHPTALIPTWIGLALGYWRLPRHQPQRKPPQAVHAHQRDRRAAGFSRYYGRNYPQHFGNTARNSTKRGSAWRGFFQSRISHRLDFQGHARVPVVDLCPLLRALLHRRTPLGKGLTHGHDAQRFGHGRRAPSGRLGKARARAGQPDPPKRKPSLKKLWPQFGAW